MALSTGAKVFLGLAGLGIGYAVYDTLADDKKKKAEKTPRTAKSQQPSGNEDVVPDEPGHGPGFPPPLPPTPKPPMGPGGVQVPEITRDEPLGGWEFRFQNGIETAIVDCRADTDVTSNAEAQVCVLTKLYPENRPWGGTKADWQPWMHEARQAVHEAIAEKVFEDYGSWQGWKFSLWQLFDRSFVECRQAVGQDDVDAITHCVATLIWPPPSYDWPPDAEAPPWHHEAWNLIRDRVVLRLQGPGLGTLAG